VTFLNFLERSCFLWIFAEKTSRFHHYLVWRLAQSNVGAAQSSQHSEVDARAHRRLAAGGVIHPKIQAEMQALRSDLTQ
jgi:hypothetical protein